MDAKAILAPSGDQAAEDSKAGLLVMLVWPEPSAFMTYISALGAPSLVEVNAMRPQLTGGGAGVGVGVGGGVGLGMGVGVAVGTGVFVGVGTGSPWVWV